MLNLRLAGTGSLFAREITCAGQHIDLSMLEAGLFFLFPDAYQNHTLLDDDVEQKTLLSDLLYTMTLTKDGGLTGDGMSAQPLYALVRVFPVFLPERFCHHIRHAFGKGRGVGERVAFEDAGLVEKQMRCILKTRAAFA